MLKSYPSFLYCSNNQFLQVLAFNIVSAVVNVLELITNNVSSAENPSIARLKSIGSTLAKNLIARPSADFTQEAWDLMAS